MLWDENDFGSYVTPGAGQIGINCVIALLLCNAVLTSTFRPKTVFAEHTKM